MKEFPFTLEALHSAFQSVKENHGCAGVDAVTVEQFEGNLDVNLRIIRHQLAQYNYSPLPLMTILVDKGNGEARKLGVPSSKQYIKSRNIKIESSLPLAILCQIRP